MARTEALDSLAAGFLHAELPVTPMHIGSVAVFDGTDWFDGEGRLRLDELRAYLSAKLAGVPKLRQYPVWPAGPFGRPRWIDDADFDIRRHVRSIGLPSPGTEKDLQALVEDLHMQLLDRRHPLWEVWFVTGLSGDRVAMVEKIHHALVDGIGGVDLTMMVMDIDPDAIVPPVAARPPEPVPAPLRVLADSVCDSIGAATGGARHLVGMALRPWRTLRAAGVLLSGARSVASDLLAPRSTLNSEIGYHRRYRVIRRSLDATRDTAHVLGVTINDVVLAAASAGLREILDQRHEVPAGHLHALVPVSVRGEDEHHDLGNRVAAMMVGLPVDEPEPAARLHQVHRAVRDARQEHQPELVRAALSLMDSFPEILVGPVASLVHHQPLINLVITNVPGPQSSLYLMGAPMLEIFPVVPLARNLTLSVGILSYAHNLALGLWADEELVPDIELLVQRIEDGFEELDGLAKEKRTCPRPP